jgi:NADH-quinone oxidoreductase subunit N
MSAVSLYYYLQVLKQIYVADPPPGAKPLKLPWVSQIVLLVLAVLVILLGCAPGLLVGPLENCIRAAAF